MVRGAGDLTRSSGWTIMIGAKPGWPGFLFLGMGTAIAINALWPSLLIGKSAPPDTLLQRFPGPVTLNVGRPKFLFLLIGATIFGGVSWWALQDEHFDWFETIALWLAVSGCAAAIPLMIVVMLQGSSLRLDDGSLAVKHGWRSQLTRWVDTSVFEVATMVAGGADMKIVVFDDATNKSSMLGAMSAKLVGRSGALPDTYGLSPEELAWLLNGWRDRALALRDSKPQG
jgi:hypothetical protein